MARTRAERRHNTHVKTTARKACGCCSAKVTPSGEASTCSRCVTDKGYSFNDPAYLLGLRKKDEAWWLSHM